MKQVTILVGFLTIALASREQNVKIYGGQTAAAGQFPFVVAIVVSEAQSCSGAIIDTKWVVTGADCVLVQTAEQVSVWAGSVSLDQVTDSNKFQVTDLILHPDYNVTNFQNNLALLKLKDELAYGDDIQQIAIADVEFGVNYTVPSWGMINITSWSNDLLYVQVASLSDDSCSKLAEGGEFNFERGEGQFCALNGEGSSPCRGDMGAPIVADSGLVGIVSYGIDACGLGFPDVYTNIFYYQEWINATINS